MKKIFVTLLGLFFLQSSVHATDRIRISTPGDAAHFTMHLAQKKGFLKEEGFDAEVIVISGPVANVALSNGDTDYFSGFGSALRAILQACRFGLWPATGRPHISCCRAGLSSKPSKISMGRPSGSGHLAEALTLSGG